MINISPSKVFQKNASVSKIFAKIVRPVLDALGLNGLTSSNAEVDADFKS